MLYQAVLAISFVVLCASIEAHEIAPHVQLDAHFEQTEQGLEVSVRAPLAAMRDVDLPLTPSGSLDVATSPSALQHAAQLWIIGELRVFSNEMLVGTPIFHSAIAVSPNNHPVHGHHHTASEDLINPHEHLNDIHWSHLDLEVIFNYPGVGEDDELSFESSWARLGLQTTTSVTFTSWRNEYLALEVSGDPGRIHLQPNRLNVALKYLQSGFVDTLQNWLYLALAIVLALVTRNPQSLARSTSATAVMLVLGLVIGISFMFQSLGLWVPTLVTVLTGLVTLYVLVENLILQRHPHRVFVAGFAGALLGFSLTTSLTMSLQFAGAHTLIATLSYGFGAIIVVSFVTISSGLISIRFHAAANWKVASFVIALFIAHPTWHFLELQIDSLLKYPAFDTTFRP